MRRIAHLVMSLALFAAAMATAVANDAVVREAALNSVEEGFALDADFEFELTPRLAEVVSNGVPLYFLVEFQLGRHRWYWFDEQTASARLQLRLSYHALSRQFRLSTGLLQQNFGSLNEALNVLKHLRHWLVVERTVGFSDAEYEAAVRIRLDTHQLPKPFQLSAMTSRELQLESPWKRFTLNAPQQLPAPVEAREPHKGAAQ